MVDGNTHTHTHTMSSVNTPALNYGRQNKRRACKLYQQNSEKHYSCFVTKTTGLHVRSDILFIGASSNALIECKCHGKGLLEIKCQIQSQSESLGER